MNEKVQPGDDLEIGAQTWNEIVDSKNDYLRKKANAAGNASSFPASVKVKNNTGGVLRKGAVVAFDGYPLDNAYVAQDVFWFKGIAPTANSNGFGIVTQAIAAGDIGPCVTTGTCAALVNVTNASHKFANLSNGTTLQSAETGPVRIDYKPGTGAVECIVTIAPSVSASDLVVFQLTGPLGLGGIAPARACVRTAAGYVPTGAPITVRDPYTTPGCWAGLPGYRGIAARSIDGRYDIVFMERVALFVYFQMVADRNRSSGTFTGLVGLEYQHGNQPPPGMTPAGHITIRDLDDQFLNALAGGFGTAVWNDVVGVWDCIALQQRCFLALASINNPPSPGDPNGPDQGMKGELGESVPISGFRPIAPAPFNQVPNPVPTAADNLFQHMGKDFDDVLIAWDDWGESWIIIDVTRHPEDVITDIRIKSGNQQIEVKKKKCALETNVDSEWADKIPVGSC